MKVKEMIEILKQLPRNANIKVNDNFDIQVFLYKNYKFYNEDNEVEKIEDIVCIN